jgi:spermidine synthase
MNLDKNWFSEINPQFGVAFSLQIKEKLYEEQTPYQKIGIYDTTDFGKLMTIDDLFMVTDRDNFLYHEMMSHTTLFTHPNPRQVVIIGGGDCGTLREVLKHPTVEHATQVEIDERVTRLAEQYFPSLCESNHDHRANLLFEDGIQWMATAPTQSIDVIIIDSTDPIGPAAGLFNLAFYQQCRRVLREDGILVQQTESPLLHLPLLQSVHQAMREAGFKNARTFQFPQCIYPSGWWTGTMAGNHDLTQFRTEAVKTKTFATHYYNAEIHQASFALPNFMLHALS